MVLGSATGVGGQAYFLNAAAADAEVLARRKREYGVERCFGFGSGNFLLSQSSLYCIRLLLNDH
jgi:hypothetical protein